MRYVGWRPVVALHPVGTAVSFSPLSSTLRTLVTAPTTALSPVSATAGDLEGGLLAGPVQAPALNASLNLNVDVPFLHVDNLRLDVGLNPVIGSSQPLATLAVGGTVGVGSAGASTLGLVPQVQLGVGGPQAVSGNGTTQVVTPSGPIIGAGIGTRNGVTTSVNTGAAQGAVALPTGAAPVAQGRRACQRAEPR